MGGKNIQCFDLLHDESDSGRHVSRVRNMWSNYLSFEFILFLRRVFIRTEKSIKNKGNKEHERHSIVRRDVFEIHHLYWNENYTISEVEREEIRFGIVS